MPLLRNYRRPFDVRPASVRCARDELARFAAMAGANPDQVSRIRLAVSEAVTDAVLRGGGAPGDPPGEGEVLVSARVNLRGIAIVVRDRGAGLTVAPDHSGLGLGTELLAQLTDEMTLADRAHGGTELRMRFALAGWRRRARPRHRHRPGDRRRQAAAAAA